MRNHLLYLLALMLLMSACSPRQAATPDVDAVATVVQATLDAQPTWTPVPPTDTPEPVVATFTPEAPSPTETPTTFFTETPTLTPTVSPEDPLSYLGQPVSRDTLDTGAGFGIDATGYEDDFTRITASEGSLFIHNYSTIGWRGWRVRPPKLRNAYIEGTFTTHGCQGGDQYGLVFRAPDYASGRGYYFALTCDGRFNLMRWTDDGTSVAINNTSSDAIRTGSGQVNRVGIMMRDSNLRLYINGRLVQELNDDALQDAGYYGLFASGVSGTMVISLDEIAYWNLP